MKRKESKETGVGSRGRVKDGTVSSEQEKRERKVRREGHEGSYSGFQATTTFTACSQTPL